MITLALGKQQDLKQQMVHLGLEMLEKLVISSVGRLHTHPIFKDFYTTSVIELMILI